MIKIVNIARNFTENISINLVLFFSDINMFFLSSYKIYQSLNYHKCQNQERKFTKKSFYKDNAKIYR